MSNRALDLYNNVYADFASDAEAAVRQATYGEDLGQSSWLTAQEWLEFADQLAVMPGAEVLEVGSGSGGPAVYWALVRGCRVTGVDINEHGVRNALRLAEARGVAERAHFQAVDASQPLPFPEGTFDAVVSNDAMCHIGQRVSALRDWYRVLRPGGRALFTDAMVLTGIVSHEELAIRSSIGFYISSCHQVRTSAFFGRPGSLCCASRMSRIMRPRYPAAGTTREPSIGRRWWPGRGRRTSMVCNASSGA